MCPLPSCDDIALFVTLRTAGSPSIKTEGLGGEKMRLRLLGGITALGVSLAIVPLVQSAVITSANIVPVPVGTVGSGNGTLDYIFFTESSGGAGNSSGSFNGDNANTDMPTGSGKTTANESYITSI